MTSGNVSDAIDHGLFNLLAAPADLGGPRLSFAIAVARLVILLAPVLLLWTWFRGGPEDRRATVTVALAGALGLGAAAVLSSVFFEPRDFMEGLASNVLDRARDSGYPSDHATVLFALAIALRLRWPPASSHIWMPALALAVAVGWACVFLGVH